MKRGHSDQELRNYKLGEYRWTIRYVALCTTIIATVQVLHNILHLV